MGRRTRRAAAAPAPAPAPEPPSSGEESSGEESSGEDDAPATLASESAPRQSGRERREAHQRELQAARAANREAGKGRGKATKAKAKEVEAEKKRLAKKRLGYLLEKADVFKQFLGAEAAAAAGEGAAAAAVPSSSGAGRRRRLTEREGDEAFLKQSSERETIPRLTAKQTKAIISGGAMRDYQVEGLNWLIRGYHRGLNGILADEMGLGKTLQSISLLAYQHRFEKISGPHLVVVPKTTLGNWCKEFGRWYPALRVLKFYGTKDERSAPSTPVLSLLIPVACVQNSPVASTFSLSLIVRGWVGGAVS